MYNKHVYKSRIKFDKKTAIISLTDLHVRRL